MYFQSTAVFVGGGGSGLVSVLNLTAFMLSAIWNEHNAANKLQTEDVNMVPVHNSV
jgi:hypothetical protein